MKLVETVKVSERQTMAIYQLYGPQLLIAGGLFSIASALFLL